MKTKTKPTKKTATRIIELLSHGLVNGLGNPKPGEMCVEAAVCFALDLPHGDKPPCVGTAVRDFKIALNDSSWSDNMARANGMRRLAIAQLGSDEIDQKAFSSLLALRVTQKLLPNVLRDYSQYCSKHVENIIKEIADQCESAKTNEDVTSSLASLDRLDSLARLARLDRLDSLDSLARLARLASLDRLDSLARLARLASLASLDRLDSLARLARLARLDSLTRLARLDSLASLARLDTLARLDKFLAGVAEVAVSVLIELKSPGCKWLSLTEGAEK